MKKQTKIKPYYVPYVIWNFVKAQKFQLVLLNYKRENNFVLIFFYDYVLFKTNTVS